MLRTLNINHFRGIDNLDLGKLDQINIIAGPNNSGKTSILEMIESLEAPDSFYKWGTLRILILRLSSWRSGIS